jgi:hypothetical protein
MSQLSSSGSAFAVADVEPASQLLNEAPYAEVLPKPMQDSTERPIESYSRETRPLVRLSGWRQDEFGNGLLRAVNMAYDDHRPLALSPDMIWLAIAQGVAAHINADAEALRSRFVRHEGKAKLTVIRDEFLMGFAGNDWEGVFTEFSGQIRDHIGADAHGLIVQEFSTTGIVERAAVEITLMTALQAYFDYTLVTRCGIPAITLEGTPEDWSLLHAAALQLEKFDLEWWIQGLAPVLEQFAQASCGQVDREFWSNFYKVDHASGGPYIDGHIINLFPYTLDNQNRLQRNRYVGGDLHERKGKWGEGIASYEVTDGLSRCPFMWEYREVKRPMELLAGFVGFTQDHASFALRPEIGWAVRHTPA